MKQSIFTLALLFSLSIVGLSSCNKSEVQSGLFTTRSESDFGDEDDAAKNHGDCCCDCPNAVATVSSIDYGISFSNYPELIVSTDIFYRNSGPQGTLRLVLKKANGDIASVAVVPAYHTSPGDSAMVHKNYHINYEDLPCKLRVTGRPSNLECTIRSKEIFDIVNQVSRN